MRRGSRVQKTKKSEGQNDVEDDITNDNDDNGSGSEVETSSPTKKRSSRINKKNEEEVEKQENERSTRRRKKDENVNAQSDIESEKPVNKKKKGKENDKSLTENGKAEKNGKSPNKGKNKDKAAAAAKEESEDDEYEVEKIVDQRTIKGRRQFLIRWKGYSSEFDTWEHEKDLDCNRLIEEFLAELEEDEKDVETEGKTDKLESDKKDKNKKSNKKSSKAKKDLSTKDDEEAEVSDDSEYEVDRIVDVQFKKNKQRVFLIRWKGFSAKDDSWEPEEYLNCPELINKFMEKLEQIKNQDSRELRTNRSHTNRYTLTMYGDKRQSRRNFNKERKTYYECD